MSLSRSVCFILVRRSYSSLKRVRLSVCRYVGLSVSRSGFLFICLCVGLSVCLFHSCAPLMLILSPAVSVWSACPCISQSVCLSVSFFTLIGIQVPSAYSTPRGKTDELEELVNRELNVTRSWNFIYILYLAWFIDWMIFKLICIFYNFKAPLLENH